MSDVTTIEADVPERYADAVSARLQRAADEDVVGRIWRKDGTLWAPEGTPEVTNRLGWLDIAERERENLQAYTEFAEGLRAEGYRDAVVLGMGGSSLAPEVFRQSFGKLEHGLTLHVLDSTHPAEVREVCNRIELDRALLIVSSKSGGTIEPMSMFKAFFERQGDGSHYAAVTDPGSSLEALAGKHGFRRVFAGDPDIGGRYSALSPFGLVPAAAAGIDLGASPGLRDRRRRGMPRRARQRGPVAGLRARRARAAGPRQADLRRRRAADQLRDLGRAARRRVHGQAGPRHPADRRRAAARPRRLRRGPRVRAHRARRRREREPGWPRSRTPAIR